MRVLDISDGFETGSSPTAETAHIKLGDDGLATTDVEAKAFIIEHSTSVYTAFRVPVSSYAGLLFSEGANGDGAYLRHKWTGTASTSLFELLQNNGVATWQMFADGLMAIGDGSKAEVSIFSGSTNTGLIRAGNNDGVLIVTSGTNSGNGLKLSMWGGTHATRALDFAFNNATNDIIAWDESANELQLGEDTSSVLALKVLTAAADSTAPTLINLPTGGTAAQAGWMSCKVNGTVSYFPFWQ